MKTVLPIIDSVDYSFKPFETWLSLCAAYGMFIKLRTKIIELIQYMITDRER